jgi:hypothetical protein
MHNTHMVEWIDPLIVGKSAGTWTPAVASNVVSLNRTAGDASFTLTVPVTAPRNSAYRTGCLLEKLVVYYEIDTAAADDFATVELEKMTFTDTAGVLTTAGEAVDVTLDAPHDTAAERKTDALHAMTVTLDTPAWVDEASHYSLEMIVDAAATTVFKLFGVEAYYTLRA